MAYSFDGTTKIISLTSGTTTLDAKDCYSRWKDWVKSAGSKFLQAFSPVGGDPVDEGAGIYITTYYFLINGWRLRPQEASHTLKVTNGAILTDTGASPFVNTEGTYNVRVEYSQPIKSETVNVPVLLVEEHNQLMRTLTIAKYLGMK